MEAINKCSLCLETGLNVADIEETVLEKLKYVLLNLTLGETSFRICKTCEEKIGDLYEYKTCLIEALAYPVKPKEFISGEDPDKYFSQNAKCHLCEHENSTTICFSEVLKDPTVNDVLNTHMPEIKLDMHKDPVICGDCQQCLSKYSSWVSSWSLANKLQPNKEIEHPNSDKPVPARHKEIMYDILPDSLTTNVTTDITDVDDTNENLAEQNVSTKMENSDHSFSEGQTEIIDHLLQDYVTNNVTPGIHISDLNAENENLTKQNVTTKTENVDISFPEGQIEMIYDLSQDSVSMNVISGIIHIGDSNAGNKSLMKENVSTKIENSDISFPEGEIEMSHDLSQDSVTMSVTSSITNINDTTAGNIVKQNVSTKMDNSVIPFPEDQKEIIYDLLQDSVTEKVIPGIIHINDTNADNHFETPKTQNLSAKPEPPEVYLAGAAVEDEDSALELEDVKGLTHDSIDIKCEEFVENKFPVGHKLIGTLVGSPFNTFESNVLRINLKRMDFKPKKIQIILKKYDMDKFDSYSVSSKMASLDLSQYVIKPLYEVITNPYAENDKTNGNVIENPTYKCPHCSLNTKSENTFKFHLVNHAISKIPIKKNHDTSLYECRCCHYKTENRSYLIKHSLCHLNPRKRSTFTCDKCPYQGKYKSAFKKHLKWHNRNKEVFLCHNCTYKTASKSFLILHMSIHSRIIKALENDCYECLICSSRIFSKERIRYHLEKHEENILQQKCEECDFTTICKSILRKHLSVHKKSKKMLKCSHCNYNSHDTFNFRKHVRVTHTTTWFNCQLCDFRTHIPHCLSRHMKTHEKKRMHYCDICPYKSQYKLRVEQHKKRHQPKKVRTYKCYKCDFQTKYKMSLRGHVSKHFNSDEFGMHNCDKCGYKTESKGHFDRHLAAHEKKKIHECVHCSYKTNKKCNLKAHAVIHQTLTETQFYKCLFCAFMSRHKQNVKNHTKKMHTEKLSEN